MQYFLLPLFVCSLSLTKAHTMELTEDTNVYLNLKDMYAPETHSMSQDRDTDWHVLGYVAAGGEMLYIAPTPSLVLGMRTIYQENFGMDVQARWSSVYVVHQLKAELSGLWFFTTDRTSDLYIGAGYGCGNCTLIDPSSTKKLLHGPKLQIGTQGRNPDHQPSNFWDLSFTWGLLDAQNNPQVKGNYTYFPTLALSHGYYF